mmetsp:Transcript_9820/g.14441  ORF Transcript_9820/g.14441 Transcript_9820/m.14441 type:complete len:178 (-) Transcript_9820:549-1082(-)
MLANLGFIFDATRRRGHVLPNGTGDPDEKGIDAANIDFAYAAANGGIVHVHPQVPIVQQQQHQPLPPLPGYPPSQTQHQHPTMTQNLLNVINNSNAGQMTVMHAPTATAQQSHTHSTQQYKAIDDSTNTVLMDTTDAIAHAHHDPAHGLAHHPHTQHAHIEPAQPVLYDGQTSTEDL